MIEGSRHCALKFVYPKTIVSGEELTIENKTDPKRSARTPSRWYQESEFPETTPERKKCFTPKHICMSIAKWHGVKGETTRSDQEPGQGRQARLGHRGQR